MMFSSRALVRINFAIISFVCWGCGSLDASYYVGEYAPPTVDFNSLAESKDIFEAFIMEEYRED